MVDLECSFGLPVPPQFLLRVHLIARGAAAAPLCAQAAAALHLDEAVAHGPQSHSSLCSALQEALRDGRLLPGGLITEGTAGSTGVSLAMVGAWSGRLHVRMRMCVCVSEFVCACV